MEARNFCIREADVRVRRATEQHGTSLPLEAYTSTLGNFKDDPACEVHLAARLFDRRVSAAYEQGEDAERCGEAHGRETDVNHARRRP